MANYELKNGQGSAFKNDKKGNEKAPDIQGTFMIHDKEVKLAMWVKESSSGSKYFSIKVEDKEPSQQKPEPKKEEEEEFLPF